MKLVVLSLLAGTLFFSCKKQDPNQKAKAGLSFGRALSAPRALNKIESDLATTVCKLFKNKREYFETLEDNTREFDYNGYEQTCGESRRSIGRFVTRLRVPTRAPIFYESNFSTYMDELLTDKQGFLSHYCTDLLSGKPSGLIKSVGGKMLQLEVRKVQSYIVIGAAWYYPNARGVMTSYLIDKAAVHTNASTRSRMRLGVIKERTQSRRCSDGRVKSYQQRLL